MKKLFTALMLTMATTSMMAQEPFAKIELSPNDYAFTNSKFSVNGQSQLFSFDDKTSTFALYDEYFTKQREFKTIQINSPQSSKYCSVRYNNYDEGGVIYAAIIISQTLFNSDEKYEYLSPIYDIEKNYYTGINVASEDGTILQTINFGNYYSVYSSDIHLCVVNGKKYLFIEHMKNPDSTNPTTLIYRIDSETSQINFVAKHEGTLNIHPRVADRSDMITVEMNEEGDNGIREIIVSNAAGQTITRVPVEKGQKSVTIPASELSRGMNIVDAIDRKGHNANKVIVK